MMNPLRVADTGNLNFKREISAMRFGGTGAMMTSFAGRGIMLGAF